MSAPTDIDPAANGHRASGLPHAAGRAPDPELPEQDDDFAERVAWHLADKRARREADRQLAEEDAGEFDLGLMSLSALDDTPMRFRIDGIMLHEGMLLISGEAKIGKTTFVLELTDCLCSGRSFVGLNCRRVTNRVAYFNLEMPQSLLRHYAAEMDLPLDSSRVQVADLNGRAGKLALALLREESRRRLAVQLRKAEIEVLIIDPLSALVASIPDGNSNDNDLMRRLLEAVKALAAEANIDLVVIVTHTGHDDKGRPRGASSQLDTPDMLWSIEKCGEDRKLTVKGRGVSGEVTFRLDEATHRLESAVTMQNAAVKVLQALRATHGPMTPKEIEQATELSQRSVSDALRKLQDDGVASQVSPPSGRTPAQWVIVSN